MPKKISKPFVIATEGATVDGRNISRDWLTQMASNYDPKVYTAVEMKSVARCWASPSSC